MSDLTPSASHWLATHHGVITTAVLRRYSVSKATTQRLVRSRVLVSPYRGVYVLAAAPETLQQRCAVLSAAHPSGFVTGPTAGALLGLRRMPRVAELHFSVRHGIHLDEVPGVRFRQTTVLPPAHRMERADGIATASWDRLAFDLAADLDGLDHLSVLEQLLHEGRTTRERLFTIGLQLCHPGRRGSRRFEETLSRLSTDAPRESHPEVVLAVALRDRGVPVENQSRLVRGQDGRVARVDLAVPAYRWGVELDIHPEHRTLDGRAKDARRERDLHRLDWQIEPVTEQDMVDVEAVADELTELYHARRRALNATEAAS